MHDKEYVFRCFDGPSVYTRVKIRCSALRRVGEERFSGSGAICLQRQPGGTIAGAH